MKNSIGFMDKKLLFFDSVGFDSMKDFLGNVFMSKTIIAASGIFVAMLCYVDRFIEASIFSPSKGIYILFFTTMFDILLGVSVAVRNGGFDSNKFSRAWARFVTQIAFITILNQSHQVWPVVADWMVNTLLLAFVLTTLWSAFRNAHALKWIQKDTYLMIEKLLSIQNLFEIVVNKIMKPKPPKKHD